MNHITNDRGEVVMAIGAPGSIRRVEVEYPTLIEQLTQEHAKGTDVVEAIILIKSKGITSNLEIQSVLHNTPYIEMGMKAIGDAWTRHITLPKLS